MDKLNEKKVAFSLAGTSGVIYVICAILVAISPVGTVKVFGYLFHGIDVSKIMRESVTFMGTVIGLIEIIILGAVVGYIFAMIYNKIKE